MPCLLTITPRRHSTNEEPETRDHQPGSCCSYSSDPVLTGFTKNIQSAVYGLCSAEYLYEYGPTQNHKLKTLRYVVSFLLKLDCM